MINNSILDQIIIDSRNTQSLESHLTQLSQMPEHYVNSVCSKSLDEMTEEEQIKTVEEIEEYLKGNVETEKDFLRRKVEENEYQECTDDRIKTISDFGEDDNLGYKKEIDGITYYKVSDIDSEAQTVFIKDDNLEIV